MKMAKEGGVISKGPVYLTRQRNGGEFFEARSFPRSSCLHSRFFRQEQKPHHTTGVPPGIAVGIS
jgi:hypothetical protein